MKLWVQPDEALSKPDMTVPTPALGKQEQQEQEFKAIFAT